MCKEVNSLEILSMLQLCDSQFPVGSFNHSYGMENYLRTEKVNSADSLKVWVRAFLKDSFSQNDALAIRFVYDILAREEVKEIWVLDEWMTVQSIPMETRNAGKLVGRRMCELLLDLYDSEIISAYQARIKKKESYGHPAIVFAMLMHKLEVPLKRATMYHMYATISTLVQNAVRTIPLGQKDGQLILKEFADDFENLYLKIEMLTEDDFGANIPGLEMAQIKHETQVFRLFMS
ncbi:urease accessory protein UreF [uncultured Clostridium sp.]|jgi:urease accessory protein|uniref:urease accessory protein UreF n=1 Tax=uncultured Clostridium sp. TaxID=59620 RepID=UPI0026248F40|nr:urease accessory protein UreF [uncultured Clostridium sp.]